VLLWVSPSLFGAIEPAGSLRGFVHDVGIAWLALAVVGVAIRVVQLWVERSLATGLVWALKLLTDPFHDVVLYHRAPLALLRGERDRTALASYWPYADTAPGAVPEALPGERVHEYSALMSASQPLVAEQVLDAYPLHRHRCLLDVGGGEGAFLRAAAQRAPDLRLMLFDLPPVAERARPGYAGFIRPPGTGDLSRPSAPTRRTEVRLPRCRLKSANPGAD
jgi:hypothetical protein